MNTINRLRQELSNLQAEREMRIISDEFAYTNGTVREFDRKIYELREQIHELREGVRSH